MSAPEIVLPAPGQAWRHYKGGLYLIVGLAYEEATGNVLVVYRGASFHAEGMMFTRPMGEFLGQSPDHKPRFDRSPVHDDKPRENASIELPTAERPVLAIRGDMAGCVTKIDLRNGSQIEMAVKDCGAEFTICFRKPSGTSFAFAIPVADLAEFTDLVQQYSRSVSLPHRQD